MIGVDIPAIRLSFLYGIVVVVEIELQFDGGVLGQWSDELDIQIVCGLRSFSSSSSSEWWSYIINTIDLLLDDRLECPTDQFVYMHLSRVRPLWPFAYSGNWGVRDRKRDTCKDLCFFAIKKTIIHFGLFPYDYILGTMYKGIMIHGKKITRPGWWHKTWN